MPQILITETTLLTEPGSPLIEPGFVLIRDGLIRQTGTMAELPPDTTAGAAATTVINGKDCLTMPGLVNGHCHGAMTLFRGLADDLELMRWLQEYIFPAEAAHVSPEMVYWCSRLAAAEMLLSGTTCVADGYFYEEQAVRAFAESGLRAIAAQGIIDFPAPGVADPAANIATAARFIEQTRAYSPRVQPAVFAHSPYTCSNSTLERAKQLARESNTRLFIHLAENRAEQSMIAKPAGNSPVRHLDALGILDSGTVCVHCVWVDQEDLDILAARGAGVVICPQSHLKLASGMAPLGAMLARGIPVTLGTDGAASNNGLDLFREMDIAAKVQKVSSCDPVAVPAATILRMAVDGMGLFAHASGTAGSLRPGASADLIMLDLAVPHLTPFYNPELLVYSGLGSDCRTVIVDGRIVVRDRKLLTMDLQECMDRVRSLAQVVHP